MTTGWDDSAAAWIAVMGKEGDFSRRSVLDRPMMERVRGGDFQTALDVGCGEGWICRMLTEAWIKAIGVDPTEPLIEHARLRDPDGDYRLAVAEELPFPDNTFDLVVSYLSLIDIPDVPMAIAEMTRVLKPQGRMLIANLTSFGTASDGWTDEPEPRFCIDNYLEIREPQSEWKGIRITNWHRPLSFYMKLLLCEGLVLRHFDEPLPHGGDPVTEEKYRRAPWPIMMEWEKP